MMDDVNNQPDTTIFSFINIFNSALHVSGDKFAQPQERFLTIYIQLLVQCTASAADWCHGGIVALVGSRGGAVKKCS